ncbi:DUF3592 domain-containing protein [Streptomyces longispororuber]|uniref:DUF3592 domain-containing protein n=1 Tax=Streptomyces longispororuber TaxID=68230 RepID=UPI00210DD574|nr:DUF3592 domain-containing protein [Streptomyces longispororuber]MCQ4207472.1 DUF3592 domain-containing protein [Streptomyces longispororuber]
MRVRTGGRGAGWWITFGVIAFGGLFLVIGLVMAGRSISFLTSAERADGTVVALDWESGGHSGGYRKSRSNNGPVAHPVVEFTSADGTSRSFRESTGSNPPSYEVGERVEVLYRADSPEDAQVEGFVSQWLLPLIFGGIGLLVTGIGTTIAVLSRRRSRAAGAPGL